MKKGQTWILNYLDTQFIPGAIKTRISDTRTLVEIEDMAGERMCLTVNVFGDIMDAETKRIIILTYSNKALLLSLRTGKIRSEQPSKCEEQFLTVILCSGR